MTLYLGGHLSWYEPQKQKTIHFFLPQPTLLLNVLEQLKIPVSEVAIGAINRQAFMSFENVQVQDADQVELYPPVDGG